MILLERSGWRLEGNYDVLIDKLQPLITLIFCTMETGILIEMSSCTQLSNILVDLISLLGIIMNKII